MANKKSSTRRILYIIGGLAVLLIAFIGYRLANKGDEGVTVETAQSEIRTLTQVVTASGQVQPEIEVNISPDVSGEIVFLGVREGDAVEKGELLVRIKPDFYQAQVEQAAARVAQSRAQVSQMKANMLQEELELKRSKDLYDKEVIPESEYLAAETSYEVARANHEAAQYGLESARAAERESREQLAKTTIYAPMSGTVSQLNVEVGERVVGTSQMQGTEMLRVALLDQMEIEVDVNENDVVNVMLGDTARIEVDAYPDRPFRGVVTEIANSARVTAQGTQEQVTNFPVKIRILDPHNVAAAAGMAEGRKVLEEDEVAVEVPPAPQLRPGMSGTVDILTETVEDVVAIPIQAVTVRDFNKVRPEGEEEEEGEQEAEAEETEEDAPVASAALNEEDLRRVVFLFDEGETRMVEVETGISDDTHIEIKKGLAADQAVVIGPYSVVSRSLNPGDKVKKRGAGGRGGEPPAE